MEIRLQRATESDIPLIRTLADRIWWNHYPDIIGPAQVTYMLDLMYSAAALRRNIMDEGQHFWLPGPRTDRSVFWPSAVGRKENISSINFISTTNGAGADWAAGCSDSSWPNIPTSTCCA